VDGVRHRSGGTGTLVGGAMTILTAAHVFTDRAAPGRAVVRFDPVSDCVFRQYGPDGSARSEVGFLYAELGAFHHDPGAPDQDWAVLRIAEQLPDPAAALPFATSVSEFDELVGLAIKIAAFHLDIRDARRTPLVSEGRLLSVEYFGDTRLAHTADMGRMSSGAAIVHATEAGEYVVVGVNRSTANLGEFNLAVPLSVELENSLRSYAHGDVPIRLQRMAENLRCSTICRRIPDAISR
jgi:hypothetical protein